MTIPDSVTSIGHWAFAQNPMVTASVHVDTQLDIAAFPPGTQIEYRGAEEPATPAEYFTFNASTGAITGYSSSGPKDVVIPRSINGVAVTSIGGSAFYGNQLTSVVIPDSVTSIGDWSFGVNRLTSVTIPDSVTSLGIGAFADNGLTSVTIPDSVTSIGDDAFNSNQLTGVVIPDSVTDLGSSVFLANQLTSVVIPDSVASIGNNAFALNPMVTASVHVDTQLGSNVFPPGTVIERRGGSSGRAGIGREPEGAGETEDAPTEESASGIAEGSGAAPTEEAVREEPEERHP
ncbi:leucine-rich repeat domain-containing protein [Sediminivirga luteola]|nr:leucine-rich repeat domain-containing protein [Sediminivirga luteola]